LQRLNKKETSELKSNSVTKKEEQDKKQGGGQRYYLRKQDDAKKSTDGIPTLRYGKGNNFHKFKLHCQKWL
jgi:hypothetical protein